MKTQEKKSTSNPKEVKNDPWEYTPEFLEWYGMRNEKIQLLKEQLWEAWKLGFSYGYKQGKGVT